MTESIEERGNRIISALDQIMAAIPPEIRQLIESVYAGEVDVGTSPTDRKELSETLELLASYFDGTEFEDFDDKSLIVAWSWWTMINRQALAIRTLVDDGLEMEAIPNVRVAFEYAMALVTLSQEDPEEMIVSLIANFLNDMSRQSARSADPHWEYREAVANAKTELDSIVTERWIIGFTKRASDLALDNRASQYYSVLSMIVHPTIVGVMGFADLSQQKTVVKEPNLILKSMSGDPLLWAVQCLCWSALAIDHMVAGGLSWRLELADVIERFEIPYADTLYPSSPKT